MMFLAAALAVFVVPANAAIITNVTEPMDFQFFVTCANGGAGEYVDFSGPVHLLITQTINGKNSVFTLTENPLGVVGIGEITGDTYHFTSATTLVQKISSTFGGQFTNTQVSPFRVIGPGPGNNFVVRFQIHVTRNANGTFTVTFDHFSTECN